MTSSSRRARARAATLALALGIVARLPAATPEAHVEAITRALSPLILVKGEPPRTVSLAERMGQLGVPAVSIAYFDHGRIEWARAWGMADRERGVLATRDTLFQSGSISKPVAAVAALRLVERGDLALDADVNDRLTSWKLPDNAFTKTRKVTLRNILNHTAGTTVWGFPGYDRETPLPSLPRLLDGQGNTEAVRVFKEPGSSWRYSGGGYTVMQLLLGDVTGLPFPELLQREVLGPLGMRSSTYEQPPPELWRAKMAVGYQRGGVRVQGDWHLYPEMAAAGLWSTPSDLARFAIGVQQALQGEGTLLSRTMAQSMVRPGQNRHGLGPVISDDGLRFGHGGADWGFQAEFTAFLDGGPGVAIMTNSDNGGLLARQLILTIAREYGWPGDAPKPVERTAIAMPADVLRSYVGRYLDAGTGTRVQIVASAGTLRAIVEDSPDAELVPEGPDLFFIRDNGNPVRFERQGDALIAVLPGGLRLPRIEK